MPEITLLGTGTSQGVPVIACDCDVCKSSDPRDKRLRCSIHIKSPGTSVVIDSGPDFRYQMLKYSINRLDGLIITHEHNDHVAGLDDIRSFNFKQKKSMPLYASADVGEILRDRFAYAFKENPYRGAPRIKTHIIDTNTNFRIGDLDFTPIQVFHGRLPVIGVRIGNFCYITDANHIDESQFHKIRGSEILVLNALQTRPHPSHYSLNEAIALVEHLEIPKAYFTHISHTMGQYRDVNPTLPRHISLAFDGLRFEIS